MAGHVEVAHGNHFWSTADQRQHGKRQRAESARYTTIPSRGGRSRDNGNTKLKVLQYFIFKPQSIRHRLEKLSAGQFPRNAAMLSTFRKRHSFIPCLSMADAMGRGGSAGPNIRQEHPLRRTYLSSSFMHRNQSHVDAYTAEWHTYSVDPWCTRTPSFVFPTIPY